MKCDDNNSISEKMIEGLRKKLFKYSLKNSKARGFYNRKIA